MTEGSPGPVIGRRVRALREERLFSRVDLAERSGASVPGIEHLERGIIARPRRRTVERLARALGVEVEELMGALDPKAAAPVALRELSDDDRRVLYGLIASKRQDKSAAMVRRDMREFARLLRALEELGHGVDLAAYIKASEPGDELRRELDVEPVGATLEEALEQSSTSA